MGAPHLVVRGRNGSTRVFFYATILLSKFVAVKNRILILVFLVLVFIPSGVDAQCAMCKAVTESSTGAGSSAATGLNSGIVYLMAFPYLLMAGVGYAIYRHKKQSKA